MLRKEYPNLNCFPSGIPEETMRAMNYHNKEKLDDVMRVCRPFLFSRVEKATDSSGFCRSFIWQVIRIESPTT
jgi:hypothetical protein